MIQLMSISEQRAWHMVTAQYVGAFNNHKSNTAPPCIGAGLGVGPSFLSDVMATDSAHNQMNELISRAGCGLPHSPAHYSLQAEGVSRAQT